LFLGQPGAARGQGRRVTFISPFIGRLDDINHRRHGTDPPISATIYDNYGYDTEILAASIRTVNHAFKDPAHDRRRRGHHPGLDVIKALVKHPLTDKGLEAFLSDWKKTGQTIA
jgi:transaldolase